MAMARVRGAGVPQEARNKKNTAGKNGLGNRVAVMESSNFQPNNSFDAVQQGA
jgi:hypothetical protein